MNPKSFSNSRSNTCATIILMYPNIYSLILKKILHKLGTLCPNDHSKSTRADQLFDVTGDQYLESLEKFVENQAERLIEGTLVLKLNPVGLQYVQSRLEALAELESLLAVAPVDYLRAYVSELGDHRALERLRRILRLLPSLKMVSVLPPPARDPTPLYLLPFGRLKVLELRGCDLSTSAAKGLLELRFTLEKLICHNSTDALRHVFASRIMEIKDSPQWNRLSFVSCACNGLVLMDESLQLLPMVEILDLSRNKFAKANNLRKCTKLKHLDLGFNSLRSIAAFSEVFGCQIVKLVLRNNALTTLRGIENMMSLEGLDVSYNIISNFSEVEILAGLPSLQNLWLGGNPICYARWFRAQVFSLFSDPEKLKLDGKRITANEFWKQQVIVASRHKQPASFGFYSPARDDADLEGSIYTKRKRISRLVNIDTEEQIKSICSDQDSSCDNEIQSRDENPINNEEAEIEDLMKRIESMKKECSDLWLQEFREWMNQTSDCVIDDSELRSCILSDKKEVHLESETQDEDIGESSRNVSDPNQLSGDESSTIVLESETFFADVSTVISGQRYVDRIGEAASKSYMGHAGGGTSVPIKLNVNQEEPRFLDNEGCVSADAGDACFSSLAALRGDKLSAKNVIVPTINDIAGSSPSLACPGSPPHFQEGILHRRHNLEEDFLQLSAESLSVASSDSNTSCSEEDSVEFGSSVTQVDRSATDNVSGSHWKSFFVGSYQDDASDAYHDKILSLKQNRPQTLSSAEGDFVSTNGRELEISTHACSGSFTDAICDDGTIKFSKGKTDWLEKKKCRRKPRRMISLPEEDDASNDTDYSKKSSDRVEICKSVVGHEGKEICCAKDLCTSITAKNGGDSTTPRKIYMESCSGYSTSSDGKDEFIETFFNSNMADSGVNEISMLYVQCSCLFLEKSGYNER
ncbi:hypothetical protein DH2020_019072 [Rehmannia glutinosa]|uniref:Uncharacterized protein n=1 Tax=Rehmannia glutinosa TaxID=99300 RepID=A0ABR0WLY0_REHGL